MRTAARLSAALVTMVIGLGFRPVPLDGQTPAPQTATPAPPAQGGAPAPPPGGRADAPPRPPLLPTPPRTAPPTPDKDGDFVIGPPYEPAPELTVKDGVPKGTVHE